MPDSSFLITLRGRDDVYFYPRVVVSLVIPPVLQQLKERNHDMLSKVYSARQRSLYYRNLNVVFYPSGECIQRYNIYTVLLFLHLASSHLSRQMKRGMI